jgi:hypothetical protein
MSQMSAEARPSRKPSWTRRWLHTFRSASPVVVAAVVALVIGGASGAGAATTAFLVLGRANHETSTASLANSRGTPLALSAGRNKAPLAVNNNKLVKNLNAQYVGGLNSLQLVTGGDAMTADGTHEPISIGYPVVDTTGPLLAGTYYVTASALFAVATGGISGYCWVVTKSSPDDILAGLGAHQDGAFSGAATLAVSMAAGGRLELRCGTGGAELGSYVYDTGITALRVLSSSGSKAVAVVTGAPRG